MNNEKLKLKPLYLFGSLLYFMIPSGIIYFLVYYLMPYLMNLGMSQLWSFTLTAQGPMILMLTAALIAYQKEGNLFNWQAFKERFRLKPMTQEMWNWTVGLIIVMFISDSLLSFTAPWFASLFPPPAHIPAYLNPLTDAASVSKEYIGVPLYGAWWIVLLRLVILFFNIAGEELWWRGYILPRQELAFGRYTWVLHGLLWTLFHVFWWWNLIVLLPGQLALSYVVQKYKNTTIGIIAHGFLNGLFLIPIVMGVLGR
jgi:membrane protease YdiL (CAAX protease family)